MNKLQENIAFQIFGSRSSLDSDVMVFVEEIPENEFDATALCKEYNNFLPTKYPELFEGREMNCNLAIIKNYKIDKVYKGTEDECNNSLFYTYNNFKQAHPPQVLWLIDRDVELKILRTLRVLLSFLSRSEYRTDVKKALKGDAYLKIETLKNIDLSKIYQDDLGKRNVSWEDYLKTMAFQLGQTIALMDDDVTEEYEELYTKESISLLYPQLKSLLYREDDSDNDILERFKSHFIHLCMKWDFKETHEYDYI